MINSATMLSSESLSAFTSHLVDRPQEPLEWLVIAHDSPAMIRSLGSALQGASSAILRIPQADWNFRGGDLCDAIELALQHRSIAKLALVGHSQSLRADQTTPSGEGYQRLVSGLRNTRSLNSKSESHFKVQMSKLVENPVVYRRWLEGDLHVQGLFYRAESGAFLAYDAHDQSCTPLV